MSGILLLALRILAALALYTFLGTALLLLWRSLKQEVMALSNRLVIPLVLRVQSPDELEVVYRYNQNNVIIGRNDDCDCVLAHTTVSANHARLAFHHAHWWIEDLFSTNGTILNDEILRNPTILVDGDIIKCGQISLTVNLVKENNEGVN